MVKVLLCTYVPLIVCHHQCVFLFCLSEMYIVNEEHEAESDDEITVPKGSTVDVVVKQLSGWWQVR